MGRGALRVTPVTSVHGAADDVTSPRLQPDMRVERHRAVQGLNVAANLKWKPQGKQLWIRSKQWSSILVM